MTIKTLMSDVKNAPKQQKSTDCQMRYGEI